ncbi:MAG: QueT transporter family protein [Gemmiger sp.]|nr:QueT transporter family protein [Gemmiger sp.]
MSNKTSMPVRRLVRCAMVAAIYTVLCLVLAPFSYGPVQVRIAEMLTLLPVFGPEYIVGVTLGCLLANLFGSTLVDVVFGTAATLLACLVTYKLRNLRIKGLALPAALPPVLFNAVIVGIEISVFFSDTPATLPVMLWNGFTVGIGEIISCMVLGVAMVRFIESSAPLKRLLAES